jgi:uncharacterized membrane protein
MKERTQLGILIIILLALGLAFAYFTIIYSSFTFYKSELNINGNIIEEKLYYNPNKPYHTLYRNFETPVTSSDNPLPNHIQITDVTCSQGIQYYDDNIGRQYQLTTVAADANKNVDILAYTDRNEYGCGFGNTLGFSKGEEYIVSAIYQLNPDTLIEYEGKHYIKFVTYSGSKHPVLYSKTLKVNGEAIYAKYVASSSEFLIYIPYEPNDIQKYNILHETKLKTHNNMLTFIIFIFMALFPSIICFIVWYVFGREYIEGDYPEELSQYPNERKAWEVSVYFHPPFGNLDEKFMPTMILDFYHRKIIDIEVRKTGKIIKSDEIFIKILPNKVALDNVEIEFIEFLKYVKSLKESKDEYFSIKEISAGWGNNMLITSSYKKLKDNIKKVSKEYIEYTGVWVLAISLFGILIILSLILAYIGRGSSEMESYNLYILPLAMIIGLFIRKTSLFIRFKKEHYNEYQQWQGFKKYLSHLDSIPRTSYKGVVMWEKYLVYATAMGVGKEVLEQLRKLNVIDQKYYNRTSMIYTPSAFGATTSSGSGGGMGGGGGIGGGGGGGR